ncbi:MAG: hypothetical protein KF862_23075 [Chitinophagaceae bacterium]|nr:hypothetical protein [Chitinophagaceae bacterium]
MELDQMEKISGSDACLLAGAGAVLGIAGIVLSGGTLAAGLLGWGGGMLSVLSACSKELGLNNSNSFTQSPSKPNLTISF